MMMENFIENYQQQVDERAALGVVPQPLSAEQTAQLVELLKNPPAEQAVFLLDFLPIVFRQVLMKPLMLKPPF